MKRVAGFEKVSFGQYDKDFQAALGGRAFTTSEEAYGNVKLPSRATAGSAGYDLISPVTFLLKPGEGIRIPTGLRVKMQPGWVLVVLPKSGLGTGFRFQLDNTCGVIDSDYYNADNEGHILVSMINDSRQGKELQLPAGKAFAQAIFLSYGITEDDDAGGERTGGFGSTGK